MLKAILIGAGDRGTSYGKLAKYTNKLQFTAVVEPRQFRREKFAREHSINGKYIFTSWDDLFKLGKIADVAIICTQDTQHVEPALKALALGYDVLLEKPMATTYDDCKLLAQKAKETGKLLQISHEMRYTTYYSKISEYLKTGKLGKVVNISMRENVSRFHYSHSFIRGNWHNTKKASPMILAKCCHDLDLMYWLANALPQKISSFGSQSFFGPANAPGEVPQRCTDGCAFQDSCFYYAPRLYIEMFPSLYTRWPVSIITDHPESKEARLEALKTTDYGKCVYTIEDHDTVDQQVVTVEFENNIIGTLTMHGFSADEGRSIRIEGTKGELIGEMIHSDPSLVFRDSELGIIEDLIEEIPPDAHGGGDELLFLDFIKNVEEKSTNALTNVAESLISHIMAFTAEKARLENQVLQFNDFVRLKK